MKTSNEFKGIGEILKNKSKKKFKDFQLEDDVFFREKEKYKRKGKYLSEESKNKEK